MSNEQKTAKIREALKGLDVANDKHWTDDGLPREGVVQKLANDLTLTRKEISDAFPGFQRTPVEASKETGAGPKGEPKFDPLTGDEVTDINADPAKNKGEFMTDAEVKILLEGRLAAAEQEVVDAQVAVRNANRRVMVANAAVADRRADLSREFPPLTVAQNIKNYIASEQAQRAAAAEGFRHSNVAPGSQIDLVMQRSNSRGWRRPVIRHQVQTGAARVE